MSLLGLYSMPSGSTVQLRMKPNDKVLTYVVFVIKYTETGKHQEAIWHPEVLSSPNGASLVLQQVRGYRLLLQAMIKPEGGKVDVELLVDGEEAYDEAVKLPKSEGPVVSREWSIVVR